MIAASGYILVATITIGLIVVVGLWGIVANIFEREQRREQAEARAAMRRSLRNMDRDR